MELGLVEIGETEEGAPGVVSKMEHLLSQNPEKFVQSAFTDSRETTPCTLWEAGLMLPNGDCLKIDVSKHPDAQTVEILVYDFDLPKAAPSIEYSYRVKVFGGKSAETYKGGWGFITSNPAFLFKGLEGSEVIVSDHWAETENTAEEVVKFIDSGILFNPEKENPDDLKKTLK